MARRFVFAVACLPIVACGGWTVGLPGSSNDSCFVDTVTASSLVGSAMYSSPSSSTSGEISVGEDAGTDAAAGITASLQIASGSGGELQITVVVESGMNVLTVFATLEPGAATYPLVNYGSFLVADGENRYPLAGTLVASSFTATNCQQDPSDVGTLGFVVCDVAFDATLTMSGSDAAGTDASADLSIHYRSSVQTIECD